jgi:hypothetical protein
MKQIFQDVPPEEANNHEDYYGSHSDQSPKNNWIAGNRSNIDRHPDLLN